MTVEQAMHAIAGASHLLALRPGGPVIQLTPRQMMLDVRNGNPRRYVAKWSDLVAVDWQVMTLDALRKAAGGE